MRLLIGLFIMGFLSACSSTIKDTDYVCNRNVNLGRLGDMTLDQKMQLPLWVKACN